MIGFREGHGKVLKLLLGDERVVVQEVDKVGSRGIEYCRGRVLS